MTTLEEAAYEGVNDELTDFAVYSKLAGFERKAKFKRILLTIFFTNPMFSNCWIWI